MKRGNKFPTGDEKSQDVQNNNVFNEHCVFHQTNYIRRGETNDACGEPSQQIHTNPDF